MYWSFTLNIIVKMNTENTADLILSLLNDLSLKSIDINWVIYNF